MLAENDNLSKLSNLFDNKIIQILKQFFKKPDHEFYLRELSKESSISVATTFRILIKLEKLNIVDVYKLSRFKAYVLSKNSFVDFLSNMIKIKKDPLENFVNHISEIPEITSVILHGKKSKTQANVILIGSYFDQAYLKSIIENIKKEFNFEISYLTLSEDQFETMTKMGLYHENRVVIYTKK